MKIHEATEQAYKNGYDKGYEDGKKDAVKHGQWEYLWNDAYCSVCGWENKVDTVTRTRSDYPYCPHCGADMRGADDGQG